MWTSILSSIIKPLFGLLAKFGLYKAGEYKGEADQKLKTSKKENKDAKSASKLSNTISQKSEKDLDSALSSNNDDDNSK